MSQYSVIGKRIPRLDGVAKVTGQAEYVHDLNLPHMLHAKVLRSPLPHARILNIDISKAERLLGVKRIITGREIEPVIYGFAPISKDETALAIGKVRYSGEELAAAAAVDEDTATEALELIRVDYEELPAYFTPEEAMAPGSILIHEGKEGNIGATSFGEYGDVEKALKKSDYVREDCFNTQIVCHCQMEPHGALASYDNTGKLTIWAPKQMPYFLQRNLARTLNMPENKIRVIKPHMGGGFGGKGDMYACDFCASLLAIKTCRPVKLIYSREEVFTTTRTRHAMKITIKTGCKKDGSLLVKDCKILADNGAYNSTSPLALYLNGALLSLPFRLRNFRYEGKAIYTNKLVAGAMRGHGYLQMRYAADAQLDLIAKDLAIDPVEMRLKNAVETGYITPNGFNVNSCAFTQSIEKAAEAIGWKERKGKISSYRGMGIGCSAFISGCRMVPYNSSAAFIKLHEDGGITLIVSESDIGQGSDSVLAMIAAEELGIPVESITVVAADTEITPNSPGTFGSRVTITGGKAVQAATADVKKQLFEIIAKQLEADPEDLMAKDGRIFVKGSPDRGMSIGKAVKYGQYQDKGRCIMGRGYYNPDLNLVDYQKGSGNLSEAYSFGSHCAEVEVDPETGFVRLLEVVSTHDCGVPINPMAVEGQNEGSISIGQGQVLYEEILLDKGSVLNPSFLEYKLPTSLDSPKMKTIHLESYDPIGPYGAKESGEGVILSTIPAIANAIGDALGERTPSLPITPEKVLEIIEKVSSLKLTRNSKLETMPFITGIILAAGESKRMGKTKQLLPYEEATLLEKVIDNVLASNIQEVIVVLGHDAGKIKEVLRGKPVKIALNAEYHLGMASSLKAGLIHLHRKPQGFMVVLGDQPLIRSNIINQVIENFALNGKGIVFPIYQNQKGHPVLFHVKYKEAVINLPPQEPIARIIESNPEDVLPIPMKYKEVLEDVDYPEDYWSLVTGH